MVGTVTITVIRLKDASPAALKEWEWLYGRMTGHLEFGWHSLRALIEEPETLRRLQLKGIRYCKEDNRLYKVFFNECNLK